MPGQEELREMKAALAERLRKVGVAGSEAPPSGEAEKFAEINRLSRNLEMLEAESPGRMESLIVEKLRSLESGARSMAPEPRRCPHCGGIID
jgi:hypothetical protein